ncbi:MAG: hypothetical protein JWO90_1280 [Solirubrobacterales bacterium]|nr:hypothetical protein [Solirubrobacterales bacterium]
MARCPCCKSPVSQFAAGCAVCGADLEAARREAAGRRRLRLPGLPRVPQDAVVALVVAVLALTVPLVGLLLAVLVARRERASDQRGLRAAMWVLGAVAVVLLVLPGTRAVGVQPYLF